MIKFKNINNLEVLYNDQIVGKLSVKNETVYFQYHQDWLINGFSISPFKLPLSNEVFKYTKNHQKEIWGVFYDCLPDGWGTILTIRECAKYNIDYRKLNILEKLSLVNKFSLGGLDFKPSCKFNGQARISLEEIANNIIDNYYNLENISNIDKIFLLGGSSGGDRPKVHIIDKGSHWIVKFPRSKDEIDVGTKEYEDNMIAKKCSININECRIIDSKMCKGFFAAKRFDILTNNKKIHTISVAGLLDIDFQTELIDYFTIFEIIKAISVNKENDYYEFFRRMVFNFYYGNKDDHAKNTSFIYDEALNGYVLSKMYDITKTPEIKYHQILCNNKDEPNDEDFKQIAKKFNLKISKCEIIINEIKSIAKCS